MSDPYGRGAVSDADVRCWRCDKLLAELVSRPWRIRCRFCKAVNKGE
jgi:phage FluMu protein Com